MHVCVREVVYVCECMNPLFPPRLIFFCFHPPPVSICSLSGASGGVNMWLCWAASPHQHRWGDRQTHLSCTAVPEGSAQTYTGYYVQVNNTQSQISTEGRVWSDILIQKERLNVFVNVCVFQVQSRRVLPSRAGGFSPEQSTGCTGEPVWTPGPAQRLWKQQHRDSVLPASGLLTNAHIHASPLDLVDALFDKDNHELRCCFNQFKSYIQ